MPLETAAAPAVTDAESVTACPWFAGLGEAERLVAVKIKFDAVIVSISEAELGDVSESPAKFAVKR
jgi:hypothetical protein